jgi:shikimate kinase
MLQARPARLVSAATVARWLGIEVETLLRWHARGAGPAAAAVVSGSGPAFSSSALDAWQDRVLARFAPLPG